MGGRAIIPGERFGQLEAVEKFHRKAGARVRSYWLCRCDCGHMHESDSGNLRNGNTRWCKSCASAFKSSHRRIHGCSTGASADGKATKEYTTWLSMRRRCTDPRDKRFSDYGGRGVTVFSAWMGSFETFLRDMGEAPSSDHQIDRIDNSKGYSPANCRWATRKEQANNKRNNRRLTIDGSDRALGEWAEISGIAISTLAKRVGLGWQGRKLLTPVAGIGRQPRRVASPLGEFSSVQECADAYSRGLTWVYDKLKSGEAGWATL